MATKRDYANAFESEIITLLVGPKLRKFTAHRGYLIKVPFFAACLGIGFEEGEEDVIKLPEDDPLAIEKVLEYLYGNKVDFSHLMTMNPCSEKANEEGKNFWASLARCYIAANKYCLEDFQNKIMDRAKAVARYTNLHASGIQELSKAGLRGCSMRMFLLQEMAYEQLPLSKIGKTIVGIGEEESKLLAEAGFDAEDLLLACINLSRVSHPILPVDTNNCDWHVHKQSEKCLLEG